ncbi:meiosis 1 arrest protein-like isoform X2 [Amphibalanus amphitrite]|uniref:meiosis 1 arrest protein-like isoform X2 n=1 Tax=Amphibalanus amphitrite TaxID=1232801 RepID=UPI001C928C28|nr:meiosis 1 arrest protein-like isoform X2 [Amphibalanus amphitrite]
MEFRRLQSLDPGAVSTDDDGTGRLEFALDIVNTEFDDFCSKQAQTSGRLQLTVLTSDPEVIGRLRRWSRAAAAAATGLQKIQVFEVVGPNEATQEAEWCEDMDADGDVEAVPLEVLRTTAGDSAPFDRHFQSWLLEQSTSTEHVRLLLPPLEAPLSLHCDMQAALVSPLSLPFTHRLLLTPEKTGWHAGGRGAVAVYHLEVTGRVARAGLCQSAIHGEPLLLRASACVRQSWDELVANSQSLRSLCSELLASGDVLIARLAGGKTLPDVSGRFAVMPASSAPEGDGGTLLLCSLVPAELVLPPGGPPPYCADEPVPQQVTAEVRRRLAGLSRRVEYNPLEVPCGLSEALAALSQKPSAPHGAANTQAPGPESARPGQPPSSTASSAGPSRGGRAGARGGTTAGARAGSRAGGRVGRGGARGGSGRGRPLFWKEDWAETGQ